jgi:hypothetical protein
MKMIIQKSYATEKVNPIDVKIYRSSITPEWIVSLFEDGFYKRITELEAFRHQHTPHGKIIEGESPFSKEYIEQSGDWKEIEKFEYLMVEAYLNYWPWKANIIQCAATYREKNHIVRMNPLGLRSCRGHGPEWDEYHKQSKEYADADMKLLYACHTSYRLDDPISPNRMELCLLVYHGAEMFVVSRKSDDSKDGRINYE